MILNSKSGFQTGSTAFSLSVLLEIPLPSQRWRESKRSGCRLQRTRIACSGVMISLTLVYSIIFDYLPFGLAGWNPLGSKSPPIWFPMLFAGIILSRTQESNCNPNQVCRQKSDYSTLAAFVSSLHKSEESRRSRWWFIISQSFFFIISRMWQDLRQIWSPQAVDFVLVSGIT